MDNKYVITTIILVALAVGGGIYFLSSKSQNNQPLAIADTSSTIQTTEPVATATNSAKPKAMDTDKLLIQDEVVGTGAEAVAGHKITVNYTGTLTDGTKFDSSLNPGRAPFTFNLGAGEVIQGWDQGFAGMKVGGKRKLTIPASLGYGAQGAGGLIPPNATLIFEVELLSVE